MFSAIELTEQGHTADTLLQITLPPTGIYGERTHLDHSSSHGGSRYR